MLYIIKAAARVMTILEGHTLVGVPVRQHVSLVYAKFPHAMTGT